MTKTYPSLGLPAMRITSQLSVIDDLSKKVRWFINLSNTIRKNIGYELGFTYFPSKEENDQIACMNSRLLNTSDIERLAILKKSALEIIATFKNKTSPEYKDLEKLCKE